MFNLIKNLIHFFFTKYFIWGLGIGPNPQSPIPNPQSPIPNVLYYLSYVNI